MKSLKLFLSKAFPLTLILVVVLSCVIVSSSAEESTLQNPTPYYLDFDSFDIPVGEDYFVPVDFTCLVDGDLLYYNSLQLYYSSNDSEGYIWYHSFTDSPSPSVRVASLENGSIVYNEAYRSISVVGDTSFPSQTILDRFFVKGFRSGTYSFSLSPSFYVDRVYNLTTSDFIANVGVDQRYNGRIDVTPLSYYGTPSYNLILAGTYVFSTGNDNGYVSGWDGKITFTSPFFLTDRADSDLLHSIFTPYAPPSVSQEDVDKAFGDGFRAGQLDPDPDLVVMIRKEGFDAGLDEGKDIGFQNGLNASGTEVFAENLLGDTLSKPFSALMKVQLFTTPNGIVFTIGTLFGTVLSLLLLLIFLKMFAGG